MQARRSSMTLTGFVIRSILRLALKYSAHAHTAAFTVAYFALLLWNIMTHIRILVQMIKSNTAYQISEI